MPRRSHGYRPYQNATSLYGWGYNGSAGPGFNDDSFTGRPDAIGFEAYPKHQRESFWNYCFTFQNPAQHVMGEPGLYMGGYSEDTNRLGDVIFGGLGVGIDFPLYLGSEVPRSRSSTNVAVIQDSNDYFDEKNPLLGRLQSHAPLPVRLDDYDSSGNRIGRENWVKIQGGVSECLGIKTSGEILSSSGNLYGWGMGEYNGGPSLHASMRYWSCVPEIIDSGSDRFYVDYVVQQPHPRSIDAYITDTNSHFANEVATNVHMSSGWTDVACMNRHRNSETQLSGNSWYAAIKNGNLYTWGHKPFGKGKSIQSDLGHKMARIYHIQSTYNGFSYAGVSGIQPTYTKVFGGNNNCAALDSDGMLYLIGEHNRFKNSSTDNSVAPAYYPAKLSTADGDMGFSWYDANYYDMAVIQNGKIFYAEPDGERFPLLGSDFLPTDHSSIFTELDDSTSAGHGWAGASGWTQAYALSFDSTSKNGGVVALNASGQIWIRPTSDIAGRSEYGLMTNPPISAELNKWSMISPSGVTFKKIILNPVGHQDIECYQIIGLTNKGEFYTTDNTHGQTFPFIDPYPDRQPATPDGNTCPYTIGGQVDRYDPTTGQGTYSTFDILSYISAINSLAKPSGFVKEKPLTDGSDGAWWDQHDFSCDKKIGWPIDHPKWKENQEGYTLYPNANPPFPKHTYSWGLQYKSVDGSDSLKYIPVADRVNNAGDRFSWLADRLPPVTEYTALRADMTDDNPNVRNGLITFGQNYTQLGDFTESANYGLSGDNFGACMATNEDGTIVAVGSPHHDSNKGKVTVYRLIDGSWTQMGSTLDADYGASAGSADDYFGHSVALSKHSLDLGDDLNGLTVAVGCPGGTSGRGEVYIYRWYTDTNNWVVKGTSLGYSGDSAHPIVGPADGGEGRGPEFGFSLDLSTDGNYLVVGAPYFDATSPAPSQARMDGGRVYVYKSVSSSTWVSVGSAIQSNKFEDSKTSGTCNSLQDILDNQLTPKVDIGTYKNANFGFSVGINDDGDTIIVGVPSDYNEDSWDSKKLGQVQFFQYNIPGTSDWTWRFTKYDTYEETRACVTNFGGTQNKYGSASKFGASVALSADGNTAVIGAAHGGQYRKGTVYFGARRYSVEHEIHDWKPQGSAINGWGSNRGVHPDTTSATKQDETHFGYSVDISADGKIIVVGSPNTNPSQEGGCVHIFSNENDLYGRHRHIKTFENKDYGELGGKTTGHLGYSVAISNDGKVFFGSAPSLSSDSDHTRNNQVKSSANARWMAWNWGEDRSTGLLSFKHPRRDLSPDRDFLWDGQDIHSFTDGWEDLTTCRWSQHKFNKYWGIR